MELVMESTLPEKKEKLFEVDGVLVTEEIFNKMLENKKMKLKKLSENSYKTLQRLEG